MSNLETSVVNPELIEAVTSNPGADLSEIEMLMDQPQDESTVDNNGYINHLNTEFALAGISLTDYVYQQQLKDVVYAFWVEGYSGGFAHYAVAALCHWIRSLTILHVDSKLKNTESAKWVDQYKTLNEVALADKDVDGMFAAATTKQLEALNGTKFETLEEADTFIEYLTAALTFGLLSPLTGADDEWSDVSESSGYPCYQNKRCGAVFKGLNEETQTEEVYYLDGFVFTDNRGVTWFTCRESREFITFPYTPTTRYVYIVDKDESDEAHTYVTEWDRPLVEGMYLRHADGTCLEVINIMEGHVTLRDNAKQILSQINIDDLYLSTTIGEITYPNYFPLATMEERDEWSVMMEERCRLEKEQCGNDTPIVGSDVGVTDEPMPRFETQEEFEAAEARSRTTADYSNLVANKE